MGNPKRPATERYAQIFYIAAAVLSLMWILTALPEMAFAKTYRIVDGDRVLTYTTFATDPAEVLEEAGLSLKNTDIYVADGESEITVRRAMQVQIRYHGDSLTVTSGGETVGMLLDRLNLPVEEGDVLSHDPGSPVTDAMEISIDSISTREETYTVTVDHETSYCIDAAAPRGSERILVPGKNGELLRTAHVTYANGVEKLREVTREDLTIPPVTQVIAVGTGRPDTRETEQTGPIIGDGYILLPTGELLTYTRTDHVRATGYTHTDAGCDMITATGTTVHRGTVAVDPRFIPYGTRMFIVSNDGSFVYGLAVAEDCGGAIKRDRMDLYFPTYDECIQFGYRRCTIYFLG